MYALIAGVTLVIVSGGGTNPYSQIFLLLFTGVFLLIFPPMHLPGKWLTGTLIAIVLWVMISSWMPFPFACATSWLRTIDPELTTSRSISAQPVLSTENSIYFICALSWLLLVLDKPLRHYHRMRCFHVLTWILTSLAFITLAGIILHFQHPMTWGTHRFSFFPNHNQTGIVLAMGGIFAMGMIIRSIKKHDWTGFLYIGCYIIVALAVFMGMSRSAAILLIGGSALCVFFVLEKRNYKFYLKIGVPSFLLFLAVFMLFGGQLLDEFSSIIPATKGSGDLRFYIYADTLKIIKQFPVWGIGLGNFRYFFPMFQEHAATSQSVFHPESSFLWLWAELGLPGIVLISVGIILLFLRIDPVDIVKTKGGRLIGFISIIIFLIGSLVEVSSHRLGTVLLAIVIFGLSQPETARLNHSKLFSMVCRLSGIAYILLALVWVGALLNNKPFTKEDVKALSIQPIIDIMEGKELKDTSDQIDTLIAHYPLMHRLHEVKGRLLLQEEGNLSEADEEFRRGQLLVPNSWNTYIYHGLFLHAFDFEKALSYWNEGINRAGKAQEDAFLLITKNILQKDYPRLRDLTYSNRDIQFLYLSRLRGLPVEFSRELGLELAINPELDGFSSEQKQALLWRFTELNGVSMLKRLLERHPVLGSENWTTRAQMQAGNGNHKESARLAVMNLPRPAMIDLTHDWSMTTIRSQYIIDSTDPLKVIALVQKQERDGFYEEALTTIQVAFNRGIENEFLEFELPLVYFYLEDYEKSWEQFKEIIVRSMEWK